jgi:hypothetical protein
MANFRVRVTSSTHRVKLQVEFAKSLRLQVPVSHSAARASRAGMMTHHPGRDGVVNRLSVCHGFRGNRRRGTRPRAGDSEAAASGLGVGVPVWDERPGRLSTVTH